jgi:hypothetical protein
VFGTDFEFKFVIKIKNENPEMQTELDSNGWLICPNCKVKFKLSDKMRWRKRRHTTCGQLIKYKKLENSNSNSELFLQEKRQKLR